MTFVDLLFVVCLLAFLLALIVPAVQRARGTARRNQCRDHLQRLGQAFSQYHDVYEMLPPIDYAGPELEMYISVHAALLPFLDSSAADISYDAAVAWHDNSPEAASQVIPEFVCPSSSHPRRLDSEAFGRRKLTVGQVLGTTDYILSVGPRDTWCRPRGPFAEGPIPDDQLGAFTLGRPVDFDDITDGLGQTMLMGEGTGGPDWPMCEKRTCPRRYVHPETGEPALSINTWINPEINTDRLQSETGIVTGGLYGTTATPLNDRQRPVITETVAVLDDLDDCRGRARGGPHRVSGFRTDHVVGCLFLFADGSVHCVQDDIDHGLYQALSTIRGREPIDIGR